MLQPELIFPLPQNLLFLTSPAGHLETIITRPLSVEANRVVTVICHPHPLYGGTMNNKVVTTLTRAFIETNGWAVRFNFRGVGKSTGVYGHASGEIEDLLAVIQWVRQNFSGYAVKLAGFSFGSYIAASVAAQDAEIQHLITIAPAVNHFDFTQIRSVACPWLLLMGEADEIVPVESVKQWLATTPVKIKSIFFPGVGHFFHGHLLQLREALKQAFL